MGQRRRERRRKGATAPPHIDRVDPVTDETITSQFVLTFKYLDSDGNEQLEVSAPVNLKERLVPGDLSPSTYSFQFASNAFKNTLGNFQLVYRGVLGQEVGAVAAVVPNRSVFTTTNVIATAPAPGGRTWNRYYLYRPGSHTAEYFLEVNMDNFPDIQATPGFVGLGIATAFRGYANVYPYHVVGPNVNVPTSMIRYRKVGNRYEYRTHTRNQNLNGAFAVDFVGGDYLLITTFVDLFRDGNREYAYAWVRENYQGLANRGVGAAYLVSRDITVADLDWDVDHVLGTWVEDESNRPWREWAFAGGDRTPSYNADSTYLYAERLDQKIVLTGGDSEQGTYEIWRYDRQAGTKKIMKSWTSTLGQRYDSLDTFLVDHSGQMVGYAMNEVTPEGAGPVQAIVRFFAGPQDDQKDAAGNVVIAGGIDNAPELFRVDAQALTGVAPVRSRQFESPHFWKVGGGITVRDDGTVLDDTVYGVLLLGDGGGYPSMLARWSEKEGLKVIYQEDSALPRSRSTLRGVHFNKEIARVGDQIINMMTERSAVRDGQNPQAVVPGALIMSNVRAFKDGQPVSPGFVTPAWGGLHFAQEDGE